MEIITVSLAYHYGTDCITVCIGHSDVIIGRRGAWTVLDIYRDTGRICAQERRTVRIGRIGHISDSIYPGCSKGIRHKKEKVRGIAGRKDYACSDSPEIIDAVGQKLPIWPSADGQ